MVNQENKKLNELLSMIRQTETSHDSKLLNKKIELCFLALATYYNLIHKSHDDEDICCEIAGIFAGLQQKNLGRRVKVFLKKHQFPPRVESILLPNIFRMNNGW